MQFFWTLFAQVLFIFAVVSNDVEGFINKASLSPSLSTLQPGKSRTSFVPRYAVGQATCLPEGFESSSVSTSVASIDPVQAFTDTLSGILNSPAILLIPIGAAVTLASLVAFFIVSYANPTEDSDENDFDDDNEYEF